MWSAILNWIFSWAGTLALVTAFVFIGWGAMSMSPPACWIARCFFTFAALLLLGKLGLLAIAKEPSTTKRIISTFILFGIIGSGWIGMMRWIDNRELLLLEGILTPNDKPTPTGPTCHIPPNRPANGVVLFFGNNSAAAYITEFPYTVIQLDDEPLLIINKQNDRITVSGKFFSRDGKIVAELLNNTFIINPNNRFRIIRPNFHKFIVLDQEHNQTLTIEFMNPSAIKIMSKYYLPYPYLHTNLRPLIIDKDSWLIGNVRIRGCLVGGQIDFHFKSDGSVDIESGPGAAAIRIGPNG